MVERAQKLLADALGVAAQALATPADDGSHDELARQLVPVRGEATDDGVVLGIAARVGLTVEQATDERVDGHVERIGHLEDVQAMPSDRAHVAACQHPLLHLVEALDGWRCIGVLERQRRHCLDRRLAQRLDDAGDRSGHGGIGGQAKAVTAARDERDSQAVLLRRDLLLDRRRRRRWRCGVLLLAPEEGHG